MIFVNQNIREYGVIELSQEIKKSLEENFGYIRLRGEVSGLSVSKAGHVFLSLKEQNDLIEAIIWPDKFQKLNIKPQDGMEVIASGKITTYSRGSNSKYQIMIDNIEVAGEGALLALYEKLKKSLQAEGLFDVSKKKLIPKYPKNLLILTSINGAVIRDILRINRDRGYPINIDIMDVSVQGQNCPKEISEAVIGANRMTASTKRPDVILIARGGGSLEDLWGFNDEILVRAVYSSDIPVITAIGHETDTCLIDLASDYRAPTPTAAAGKLFPDIREVNYKINQDIEILKKFIFDKLANFALRYNLAQQKLISRGIQYQNGKLINFERLSSKISKQALVSNIRNKKLKQNNLNEKIIRLLEQKLNNYAIKQEKINSELLSSTKGGIRDKSYLLSSNNRLLDSLNYKKTLNRGYAIIKDQDKSIIESKKVANQHKLVNIMFSDGEITVRNQNDK
tara:strand:- start:1362 stop:2720 length:1359 start_codon:yes stop_codon:yes gene_type:complete